VRLARSAALVAAPGRLGLISDLIEKSLGEVLEWHGVARYRLLESVDQYGTERLAEQEEAEHLPAPSRGVLPFAG
jgi:predicted ATPase